MDELLDEAGAGRLPRLPVGLPMLRQRWEHVAFLHWRVEAASLRPVVPSRYEVEEADGSAWVSLIPFEATATRLGMVAPELPPFVETNLRTYVVDRRGRRGIWFLDLEAASRLVVAGGRAVAGIPYHRAHGEVAVTADGIRYRLARAGGRPSHDITVVPGAPMAEEERTPLDDWLTGRWRAFGRPFGLDVAVPVRHPPWPLRHARLLTLEEDVLAVHGVHCPPEPDLVHFGGSVAVVLGAPRPRRRSG